MVKDDLLYHVQFFIFQESSWVLSKVQQCMCVCALGLGYKWFLNESSAKYQLCEAPAVQFFFFFFETLAQRPIQFCDYYWCCGSVQCSL